ncbi:MAG: hypothetical protein WBX01_04985 [Nitrososphaeraceae archaeon]
MGKWKGRRQTIRYKLEERDDPDIEILRTSQDGRIQHIRVRDNVTSEEAIRRTRDL